MGQILIQAVLKRAFLNQIAAGAIKTSSTLTEALTAAQSAIYSPTFAKGRLVVSQSGSGQSGSFQVAMPQSAWTQENVFGLTQELIELVQTVIINGSFAHGVDDGTQTPALIAAMNADDSMQGISQQQGDWTGLNIPSLGGIPSGS